MIRAIVRGLRDLWTHRFLNLLAIITLGLATVIVGAFLLFFVNASATLAAWSEGIRIIVYLDDGVPRRRAEAIGGTIRGLPSVAEVRFIPREAGLDRLREQLGKQAGLLDDLNENPLPDAFEVRADRPFDDDGTLRRLAGRIAVLPGVADVAYGRKWLETFFRVHRLFRLVGSAMAVLFTGAAIFFVATTVQMILYARRDEIEILWLVGATEGFIRGPFYVQAFIGGAAGGGLGLFALYQAFRFLSDRVARTVPPGLLELRFFSLDTSAAIVAGCMGVAWLGCYLSFRRFSRSSSR